MGKIIYKLAFCGKMKSGKTTASLIIPSFLADKYGKDNSTVFIIKFAYPIYQCVQALHQAGKPRLFMQRMSDLAKREFGKDVFVKIFEENFNSLLNVKLPQIEQEHVAILTDDVRFLAEYDLIKRLGFITIKIDADEEVRASRSEGDFFGLQHNSEIEQEFIVPDFVIQNNRQELIESTENGMVHDPSFKETLKNIIDQNKLLG